MKEVIMKVPSFSADYPKAPIYVADLVRCKECKWYGNEQKKIYECCTYWAQDGGVLVPTKADDFCSYGVKKGADDE